MNYFFGHNAINTHPKHEVCFLQMPNYMSIVAKFNKNKIKLETVCMDFESGFLLYQK